jgi:pantoate--beta-alanine ligase
MLIFKHIETLQQCLEACRKEARKVGFVPTMGALHPGHVSLIEACKADGAVSVCSIFVNPTQFNDPSDLEQYPRTPESDIAKLTAAGTDILFMPEVAEMYPNGMQEGVRYDFGRLEEVMEGAMRPGHFAGVAQVVSRLLEAVRPDSLYMGQKDFQQVAIVRRMLELQGSPVRLVMCETMREADGLAMSSRNVRQSAEARLIAPKISQVLREAVASVPHKSPETLLGDAILPLIQEPAFSVEYVELVNGYTLQPIYDWSQTDYAVICVALWLDDVRLIDNMILKKP